MSPDDRFAAVVKTVPGTRQDIWILDTTSNSSEPLIEHSAVERFPVWSPDGSRLAFQSSRGAAGNFNLYVVAIANRSPIPIEEVPNYLHPAGWTPDGRTFAWIQNRPVGTSDPDLLQLRHVEARESPVQTLAKLPLEAALVSPDGTMVAYSLREAGQVNLYMDRFPALGSRHLVARQVGGTARWRADSRELFLTSGKNVMAASIVPGVSPTAGSATVLFPALGEDWDVTRDGSKFLFAVPITERLQTISLIRNWSPANER